MRLPKGFNLTITRNAIIILDYEGRVVELYSLPKNIIQKMKKDITDFKEEKKWRKADQRLNVHFVN